MGKILAKKIVHFARSMNISIHSRFATPGYWWEPPNKRIEGGNFGDDLNPLIIGHFTTTPIINCYGFQHVKHFMIIGSVLSQANENSTVLGAGILREDDEICSEAAIISCRGPYSKKRVEDVTGQSPEVISDPALILPDIIPSIKKKNGRILLIAHFRHYKEIKELLTNEDVDVVSTRTAHVSQFVREASQYSYIASTSLHGNILAHAYGIPSMFIPFTGLGCDGIKFHDYFESIREPLATYSIDAVLDTSQYSSPDEKTISNLQNKIRRTLKSNLT